MSEETNKRNPYDRFGEKEMPDRIAKIKRKNFHGWGSTFCPGVAKVGGGWDSQFQVGLDLCRWGLDFVGGGWYPP